jgi:putative transposase
MPTRKQAAQLDTIIERCRVLYNAALEERSSAWKKQKINVSRFKQALQLKDIRKNDPEYAQIYYDCLDDVIKRLDKAFAAFFRRVKAGEKPGHPRFKSKGRYNSFTYPGAGRRENRILNNGKHLRVSGVGNVKMRYHRPIEGALKVITIHKNAAGQWHASCVCVDVPSKLLTKTGKDVGIDAGLTTYITTDTNEEVANPRIFKREQNLLARRQRRFSRKKKGSGRQKKARRIIAKTHNYIANCRQEFLHKTTNEVIKRYDTIYVEDLNIDGLAKGMLSKQVNDAAWGTFIRILEYKAESAGKRVVKVSAGGTTINCCECDHPVPKLLCERIHNCHNCGYTTGRDHNAARNVLKRGLAQSLQGEAVVNNTPRRSVNNSGITSS